MDASEIGPITDAMFERAEGQAPALIREWMERLAGPGELVMLWTGVVRRRSGCLGWGSLFTICGERGDEGLPREDADAEAVERLLSPLAHAGRVRIMQALADGPLSPSQLSADTGFQGGALYHHLRELQYAAYVAKEHGRYRLTQLGTQLLVTMTCLAGEVIEDRGEQGLAVGSDWQEG